MDHLRKLLAVHLEKYGLDEFDAAVLQQTAPRILRQFVPGIVFNDGFAVSTIARSMGTTSRTGFSSSPSKSGCRHPISFEPTIGISSERSNSTR